MPFSFSITGTVFLVFCVFAIAAAGYLVGKVTVKGVNLGTACSSGASATPAWPASSRWRESPTSPTG